MFPRLREEWQVSVCCRLCHPRPSQYCFRRRPAPLISRAHTRKGWRVVAETLQKARSRPRACWSPPSSLRKSAPCCHTNSRARTLARPRRKYKDWGKSGPDEIPHLCDENRDRQDCGGAPI